MLTGHNSRIFPTKLAVCQTCTSFPVYWPEARGRCELLGIDVFHPRPCHGDFLFHARVFIKFDLDGESTYFTNSKQG